MSETSEPVGHEEPQNLHEEVTEAHPMDMFLDDEAYGLETPKRGEIRKGTIARITDNDILVDIGYKSEGIIANRELERLSDEERGELSVGAEVSVYVLRTGDPILLSLRRAKEEKDWIWAEELMESKEIYEGEISGYNKGGLIVKLGELRGFIPASQVSMSRRWRSEGDTPDKRWGDMVNEPIVSRVIEVDRRRNRLILSERAAAREARDLLKERLIEELQVGEIRNGHVISLADFGAFVDIGGADGLVHTSEISWKRISNPRNVLEVGQEVQVKVLAIDHDQKRISLSMRALEADPWDSMLETLVEGQLVEGTITKLTKFGAFARLAETEEYGIEGLIHISELAERHVLHPREVVQEDETLTLRVIRIDNERRRIGLSLKRVDSAEYAEQDWQAAMQEFDAEDDADAEDSSDVTQQPEEAALDEATTEEAQAVEAEAVEESAEAAEQPEEAASDATTSDEAQAVEAEAVEESAEAAEQPEEAASDATTSDEEQAVEAEAVEESAEAAEQPEEAASDAAAPEDPQPAQTEAGEESSGGEEQPEEAELAPEDAEKVED